MYCLLHNILHSYCTLTARCTAHLLQATFLRAMDWKGVHELLIDAAVLKKTSTGGAAVQVERMMAMLALTAVHDIMKCEVLLPTALRVDLCADRPDRACHNICTCVTSGAAAYRAARARSLLRLRGGRCDQRPRCRARLRPTGTAAYLVHSPW